MIWKSINPTYTSLRSNFSPQYSSIRLYLRMSCFWVSRRSAKRKTCIGKTKRDAGNVFWEKIAKKSVRQMHKYEFLQKISNLRCIFVKFIRFRAVSHIQQCFHLLSSPIRSGVTADQRFAGHCTVADTGVDYLVVLLYSDHYLLMIRIKQWFPAGEEFHEFRGGLSTS